MAICTPIGDELYLFRDNTGKPAENLLISSHGAYVSRPEFGKNTTFGGWIAVPSGITLYFYGPHKMSLLDPGLSSIVSGKVNHLELVRAGEKVRNYRLSKYQSKDDGESYDSIQTDIDQNRRFIEMRTEALASGDENVLKMVAVACPDPFPSFDVLTVRNRWWMKSVTLNNVLERLAKSGHNYAKVHCVFCRSRLIGAGTHDASMNRGPS